MFNFKKLRKNVKAISPVISVLLMIAVAVVASLVAYAQVMGYMNFQTAKTGQAIQIQSVTVDGMLYVQNVGDGPVDIDTFVYIDNVQYGVTNSTAQLSRISAETTVPIQITNDPFVSGESYIIKVTTSGGTFSEITKIFP